ncbi:MAG: DUF4430 domain-containing protein [Patescibacteria group bacterium]
MKKNSTFTTIVIILVAIGMMATYGSIFSGFSSQNNQTLETKTNTAPNAPQALSENSVVKSDSFSYDGEEGKTALEILKSKFKTETSESNFGEMVKSIQGNAADEKHFWAFKVNGEMSPEGAGTYFTKSNDKITWELTALQ